MTLSIKNSVGEKTLAVRLQHQGMTLTEIARYMALERSVIVQMLYWGRMWECEGQAIEREPVACAERVAA
jgi:hypothetical protein